MLSLLREVARGTLGQQDMLVGKEQRSATASPLNTLKAQPLPRSSQAPELASAGERACRPPG